MNIAKAPTRATPGVCSTPRAERRPPRAPASSTRRSTRREGETPRRSISRAGRVAKRPGARWTSRGAAPTTPGRGTLARRQFDVVFEEKRTRAGFPSRARVTDPSGVRTTPRDAPRTNPVPANLPARRRCSRGGGEKKKIGAGVHDPEDRARRRRGALDAARRAANEPGPGDFWPEDAPGDRSDGRKRPGIRGISVRRRSGRRVGVVRPSALAIAPGPGARTGPTRRTRARTRTRARRLVRETAQTETAVVTVSAGPGRASTRFWRSARAAPGRCLARRRRFATGGSARDGDDRPAPGDHEPEVHPKTVAGLLRDAMRQPGSLRPPTKTRKVRWADEGGDPGPRELRRAKKSKRREE